ncbi:hypothetical protein OA93_21190 [Flavobacterium sp. KMS]|uniref:hypothetical protein n=1 Tax=Flavobacterium sp. KMS TaxID=1566023 RepID=UPI00057C3FF6|nr:hypothetical protein [Flavobacterium sp. KMS]KIA93974.1 hypothetical protein OA93_21190 [Flavobacterium sp. KMS]
MKYIITLFFFFFGCINSFACDCDIPKAILEFYSSKEVFTGRIIQKSFDKDSSNYTITFKVLKSYKNENIPNELSFTFRYQKKGAQNSCYWEAFVNEEWVVYASERNGKLVFEKNCSNSASLKWTNNVVLNEKMLENGNKFKIDDFIYQFESDFNLPNPISNIDSIFKAGKLKDYGNRHVLLGLYIDKNGKLISLFTGIDLVNSEGEFKYDSIYGLQRELNIKKKRPYTEFEKDAIDLVMSVKDWEIKRHNITKIPVSHIRYLKIEFDNKEMKWKYEL